MDNIINLIIPFIALSILSVMVDKFTCFLQEIMHKIPKLPDRIEWPIAYIIIFIVSFIICWRGNYSIFDYLNFTFQNSWESWGLTALVISGGTPFVKSTWNMIEQIPSSISGISTTIKNLTKKENKIINNTKNEIVSEDIVEENNRYSEDI